MKEEEYLERKKKEDEKVRKQNLAVEEDLEANRGLLEMVARRNKETERENELLLDVSKSANKDFLENVTAEEGLLQLVEKIVKDMKNFLYFPFLTVSVVIDRDVNSDSIFSVKYSDVYKQLELTVHSKALEIYTNRKEEEIANYLVHELSHIYTIPLLDLAMDRFATKKEIIEAGERLTEVIAWHVRRYGIYGGVGEIETKLIVNK